MSKKVHIEFLATALWTNAKALMVKYAAIKFVIIVVLDISLDMFSPIC